MKFLDLFAGIGGFRLGMEQAGHECVGFCEIDKFARESYKAIHNTTGEIEWHDITSVTNDDFRRLRGTVDIICGGFPCQAFSIAGKREGFADKTRGTLFFEIARAASEIRPTYLFLENVRGLLSHDRGETFRTILQTLDELGYDSEWECINSKHHGVPQNRERVFIIGHLRSGSRRKVFPIGRFDKENNELQRQQSNTITARYGSAQGVGAYIIERKQREAKIKQIGNIKSNKGWDNPQTGRVYSIDGISPCLNTTQGGQREPKIAIPVLTPDRIEVRQNGRRFKEDGEPMFTLTAQDRHGVMIREATKKGYAEAYPGDSINLAVPNSQTRRGRVGKGIANTLDTSCNQGVLIDKPICLNPKGGRNGIDGLQPSLQDQVYDSEGISLAVTTSFMPSVKTNLRIRKLTPLECFRLQGFPDWAFERASKVNSNSQLYKQAGNSVTVNVIYEIAKRLE